ncbi:hypothetical protein SCP_0106360 [Sparassis crispa]|uniref:F-box domain-containing protein n=1 Tax=Sparassis crispa TaxID=139825 RepID=A0A401G6H6_9APHY|nr:hypothetical protein SCP_0106360 [Sparassis crispa]GBE77754.1 hypothetical protein SCP_0106360 [Sparassis crispa]
MSTWKESFRRGIFSFRSNNMDDALRCFTEAIEISGKESAIYDSRAAVYEKLNRFKDALLDSKKVIDLAPNRWQGYARCSRLFLKSNKHNHALRMVQLALERVPVNDGRRLTELTALRNQIFQSVEEYQQRASRAFYHFGKLPLELAIAVFKMVLEEDHAQVISLAQVCSDWRFTILDTPSLWGTLVLSNKNPAKKAKVWRERSRGRLVALSLRDRLTDAEWVLKALKYIPLDTLRTLNVDTISLHTVRKHLSGLTCDVLRGLDVLSITRCPPSSFIEAGMQLRVLSVSDSHFVWTAAADHLTRLEEFTFDGAFRSDARPHLLWLLHQNPALRLLSLGFLSNAEQLEAASVRTLPALISLPSLTDVDIRHHDQNMNNVFQTLVAPNLRTLHFARGRTGLDEALQHLSRNGCTKSLTELRIQRCALSANVLIQFLRETVALQTLEWSYVGDGQANVVLEALAEPGIHRAAPAVQEENGAIKGAGILCPSLRQVNFSQCPDIKGGPVVRLVKTRLPVQVVSDPAGKAIAEVPKGSVVPIETIIVDGCPAVGADILPWLRSNVRVVSCVYMTKQDAKWRR